MRTIRLIAACMLLALGATAFSAEDAKDSPFGFGFQLGLGTETLSADPTNAASSMVTFQKLALQPDISFGKFGLGLDITVHFNLKLGSGGEGVEFYQPDWIPEKAGKSFLELYLPKIAYVRWGQKGEPLFAKLGSFDDGTLGNGFIMGNYSNTRFLPTTRIFGAALDLDGKLFNFPIVGIETFVGNLARFDLIGTRIYVRPLTFTELPILKELQVGATVAADRDPQLYDGIDGNDADSDSVAVFGGDLRLPIIANSMVVMAAFGDVAFQNGGRWGSAVGVGGQFFSFMPYTAQIRLLGSGFIPTYFDGSYDLFRSLKYASITTTPSSSDPSFGWLARLGFSLINNLVIFSVTADGSFKAPPANGGINDYPHIRGVFTLGEGLLAGFSIDALYEKYFLGSTGDFWGDLVSAQNAVIGAKVNYRTGPAMLSLLYNLYYDPTSGFIVTSSLMSSIRF
ncbi:MAG: hypothetical protein WCT14_03380 [Treponemataceae bacterium]